MLAAERPQPALAARSAAELATALSHFSLSPSLATTLLRLDLRGGHAPLSELSRAEPIRRKPCGHPA